MSTLDNILKQIAGTTGKVISTVGTALNAPTLGPSGSALGASLQNYGGNQNMPFTWVQPAYADEQQPPTYGTPSGDYSKPAGPSYTPTSPTGGGSGNGGNTKTGSTGDNSQQTAENGLYSRLNSILNNLSLYRQMGEAARSRAQSVRDEVVGNITDTYKNLLDRAQQAKDSSLNTLAQEDLNTQNVYGKAEGTARRAMESALGRNRMMARAMNRLNSSFYDDRQADTTEEGAKTIANNATELAGKRAAIGQRTTDTKNWYDNQVVDLGKEEAGLKSQAERDYQDQVANADFQERAYGVDAIDQADAAQNEYQSRLDQINQYIQNKALTLAQIQATAGNSKGIIDAFQAITPDLQNTLSNNTALNAGQNLESTLSNLWGLGGGATGSDTADMATYKEDPQAEYYRKLRLLGLQV